jgi:hypothetical protein
MLEQLKRDIDRLLRSSKVAERGQRQQYPRRRTQLA